MLFKHIPVRSIARQELPPRAWATSRKKFRARTCAAEHAAAIEPTKHRGSERPQDDHIDQHTVAAIRGLERYIAWAVGIKRLPILKAIAIAA
jgi:hypothetical protein